MNQKVSVIIPVYNGEKTLRKCLSSVLDQTYKNYEIIIINNNSTDKTKEIITNFHNKKIRYIFEHYKSRGAARNTGEKAAKGSIILMTDSDCIVPKDWIEKIIQPIINENYDAVQGSEESITNDFWNKEIHKQILKDMEEKTDTVIGKIDTKNFAIHKDALKHVGFTSRKYSILIDTELSIRSQQNNLKLKYIDDIKVKHFHADSFKGIIKKYFQRGIGCAIILKHHKAYLQKTNFSIKRLGLSLNFSQV